MDIVNDWRTSLAIDHDAKACEVYRANVPGATVVCGEVRDLIGDLPAADVILGGPPCQPYSSAGKREGANDARDCVPDFCAAVEKVRPRMFLMEEVDAFATDWERPWSLCAKGATGHKGFVQWARHARLETERRAAS